MKVVVGTMHIGVKALEIAEPVTGEINDESKDGVAPLAAAANGLRAVGVHVGARRAEELVGGVAEVVGQECSSCRPRVHREICGTS